MKQTPWGIAEKWYSEQEIIESIANNRRRVAEGMAELIPQDVQSKEFAKWLTHEYRLAMAKGIQMERDNVERLKGWMKKVIVGNWSVTELQEAINDI